MSLSQIIHQHCAPFAEEMILATKIAQEAGEIALRYHGQDLRVDRKPGNEPVTIADHQCSEFIVNALESAFPDDIVISEEVADKRDRLHTDRVWYVDPIDGTKDFIRGAKTYCVMIGLAIQHKPVLGVIFQPNHQSLYFACTGSGAWSVFDGEEQKLHCSTTSDRSDARLLSSTMVDDRIIRESLGIKDAESIGSIGIKMSTIAAGARDIYANPATHCSSWDTCAPEIILQEAGGKMTNLYGKALLYDNPNGLKHMQGLIATNGPLHDSVVEKLAPLFPNLGNASAT